MHDYAFQHCSVCKSKLPWKSGQQPNLDKQNICWSTVGDRSWTDLDEASAALFCFFNLVSLERNGCFSRAFSVPQRLREDLQNHHTHFPSLATTVYNDHRALNMLAATRARVSGAPQHKRAVFACPQKCSVWGAFFRISKQLHLLPTSLFSASEETKLIELT